jgi:cobalt-zinc-cadmium efflux system outer membrane protein
MAYYPAKIPGSAGLAPVARQGGVLAGAACLLLMWALPAQRALADGTAPLTLADARRLALEHNTDFRVAQAQVDAALAQLKVVREFPNPNLGLSTAKISTDGTPEGTALGNTLLNRSYDSIASLSQLFLVGKRGLMRDAAKEGVNSAEFQREDAKRLLLQAVTQAYAAALAALRQSEVMEDSAAKLRSEADIAAHRFKAGDLSASDQAQIEIAADQDELNADAERSIAKTAVVTLEILLGEPAPSGTTVLADSLDQWMKTMAPGLEEAAVGTRPDIAAAESAVRQADANVRLQQRQRIPDVTASVQFERNPPAQPDTVGVGLSLPLPLWDHFTGEVLAARAAREQSQAQLDKARIQAAADVAAARVAFHEAYQRFLRYEASLVPKSAAVARSVSYAYGKGGASVLDLLEAERNDNAIRVAAVQSKADAASTAVALEAALGRLGSDTEK